MTSQILRRASATFALLAVASIAIGASRPPVKGVSYRLRFSSKLPAMFAGAGGPDAGGPLIIAKVKSTGKRARLDLLAGPPGVNPDDYLLLIDSMVYSVNTTDKTYAENNSLSSGGGLGMLSQFAGRGGRAGGGARQIEVNGVVTDMQQLDGDTLDGRQVKHYQMVAEMNVLAMGQQLPVRIVVETWSADLALPIYNPFDLTGAVSADDPAAKLTSKLVEMRKKIDGTPVKTITTITLSGLGNGAVPPLEFTQTTAITEIKELMIDDKELQLPAGFTKKTGGSE